MGVGRLSSESNQTQRLNENSTIQNLIERELRVGGFNKSTK